MSAVEFARVLGFEAPQSGMGESASGHQDLKPLAEAYRKNGNKAPDTAAIEDGAVRAQAQHVHAIIDRIKAKIRLGIPVMV